jgi:methyl-accepting chemotaxis protein
MNAHNPNPEYELTELVQMQHDVEQNSVPPAAASNDLDLPPATSIGALFLKARSSLGVLPYDPRWEKLQRESQNIAAASYILQGGWAAVLVMIIATFYTGIGDQTWLIHVAFALNVAGFGIGFLCFPGLRTRVVPSSNPRIVMVATYASFLTIATSWCIFTYTTMVYLPEEWHGLAMATTIGIIATGGIGTSAYPALALTYMILVAAGGMLGIWVSDRPLWIFYIVAWVIVIFILHVQFVERARSAFQHVKATAQLEESEAEKRKAIEFRHEAERKLVSAREKERLREEELKAQKDQARQKELFELAAQFEETIGEVSESVANAAGQLNLTALEMSRMAADAIERSELIAEAIEQVAHGSTAAAAASDEFAMSIDNVSSQAATAAELARFTNETAMATDATMTHLTKRAESIGEVTQLIDTIAARTRLLAVNASIEAARGGEAGRGFAVVASEVKELAIQTREATGSVSSNIEDMQSRSRESAKELFDIREQIGSLENAATSIATAMDQQSQASRNLAQSIDLAASGAGEVSESTKELRGAASGVGEASSRLLKASKDLETQSDLMKAKVAHFLAHIRRDQNADQPTTSATGTWS